MPTCQDGILDQTHWDTLPTVDHETDTEKAIKEAYDQGYQQGLIDKQTELDSKNQSLTEEDIQLQQEKKQLISNFLDKFNDEKMLLTHSLQDACIIIIKKIVKNEVKTVLSSDITQLRHAITEALSHLMSQEAACLHLHPRTAEKLANDFIDTDLSLKHDATLDEFDFYLTQGHASVNGKLETRISQSIDSLMDNSQS